MLFLFVSIFWKKIKSCNLNPRFFRLHGKFNYSAKGSSIIMLHMQFVSSYAVSICTCGHVSLVKEAI
jgi:hypothetical protein